MARRMIPPTPCVGGVGSVGTIRWGLRRSYLVRFRGWTWGFHVRKWELIVNLGPYEGWVYKATNMVDEIRKRPL